MRSEHSIHFPSQAVGDLEKLSEDYGLKVPMYIGSSSAIKNRNEELANEISEYYKDKELIVLGVLKGCIYFLSDITKLINQDISIELITPNKNQPRTDFDNDSLNELADSIKINGVLQPITVRKIKSNKFEIIAGERRWRASKIAKLDTIPCYIININNDSKMLELALVEKIQRENLNPIEEINSYYALPFPEIFSMYLVQIIFYYFQVKEVY